MLVMAAVPDCQFPKLRRAAGSRFVVVQVLTWDDVLTGIRGRPVELAVVDPILSGHTRSQEIERLRVLFPSLPLMLYTTLTPRTAGVLLALGQRGIYFFQAEDGIRDYKVTGVQTCALPI